MNLYNSLNFSAGPGALPESVLLQVQESVIAVPEVGLSILGISHRSDWFAAVITELESNIRKPLWAIRGVSCVVFAGRGNSTILDGADDPAARGKLARRNIYTLDTGAANPFLKQSTKVRFVSSGAAKRAGSGACPAMRNFYSRPMRLTFIMFPTKLSKDSNFIVS